MLGLVVVPDVVSAHRSNDTTTAKDNSYDDDDHGGIVFLGFFFSHGGHLIVHNYFSSIDGELPAQRDE